MTATVRIPTPLRTATDGNATVSADGATVGDLIADLDAKHPGVAERLLDDGGGLRRFVNLFVDDEDVRFQQGLDTPVRDGATVSIIPAVAGGAASTGRRPAGRSAGRRRGSRRPSGPR